MSTDFFTSQYGNYADLPFWRQRGFGALTDLAYDARLAANRTYRRLPRTLAAAPIQRVLLIGVEVPSRGSDLERVMRTMARSRHQVTMRAAPLHQGKGKFQNINLALEQMALEHFHSKCNPGAAVVTPLPAGKGAHSESCSDPGNSENAFAAYDWMVVLDDDIALPPRFLDTFLYLAGRADLKICMPAHRFRSYQSYALTQRRWNSLVRTTGFVECGPVTAFRREVFPYVLPFPDLRWAWGTDLAWSEHGKRRAFRIGIVDATPIEHLRPVAASYESRAARLEADAFLLEMGAGISRKEALRTSVVYKSFE